MIKGSVQENYRLPNNNILRIMLPAAYTTSPLISHYTDAGMHLLKGLSENIMDLNAFAPVGSLILLRVC